MFVAAKCQLFNTSLQCKLKSKDSRKAKGFVNLKIIYNILNTVRKFVKYLQFYQTVEILYTVLILLKIHFWIVCKILF